MWIRDGKKSDPESRKNIPDPQHWNVGWIYMSRDSTHFYLEIRILFPIYGLGFPELHKPL
jgi:hypothetical protein